MNVYVNLKARSFNAGLEFKADAVVALYDVRHAKIDSALHIHVDTSQFCLIYGFF